MLAKVIAWAPSRTEAAAVLASALSIAEIHGSITNRDLLVRILRHPEFLAGDTDTHFLERHDPAFLAGPLVTGDEAVAAMLAAALAGQAQRVAERSTLATIPSGWRNNPSTLQTTEFELGPDRHTVGYRFDRSGSLHAEIDGAAIDAPVVHTCTPARVGLSIAGHLRWFRIHRKGLRHHIDCPSGGLAIVEVDRFPMTTREDEPGSLHAPMPGKVLQVRISEGDAVSEGDVLVIMEAMKMEHTLRAPFAGSVQSLRAAAGDQVEADQVLVVVEAPAAE